MWLTKNFFFTGHLAEDETATNKKLHENVA